MKKKVRSRAPMRISFGGGGTEISPHVDMFGGATLSITVAVYARCTVELTDKVGIEITSQDLQVTNIFEKELFDIDELPICDNYLRIGVACLSYLKSRYKINLVEGMRISTSSDAPMGSGLGASSVLTIAILKALDKFFDLNFTKMKISEIAFEIERNILNLSGGKQDHYASAFGGCNYIQYEKNGHTSVETIKLTDKIIQELESSLLCIYTGTSRESAHIIEDQQNAMKSDDKNVSEILLEMAQIANLMRISLLEGDICNLGNLLDKSWHLKKRTSNLISNSKIDEMYNQSIALGAYGGKIAGAGGGGFLILLIPPEIRVKTMMGLEKESRMFLPINLVLTGAESWLV